MSDSADYVPDRGDIVWIDFDPQLGHEQAGERPAVVLSRRDYNERTGLAVICPITSRAKGYPYEVPLPTGLPVFGVVLCDQVKSLDWQARGAAFVCTTPAGLMTAVLANVLRTIS
jgi:mRNA interferase MazF